MTEVHRSTVAYPGAIRVGYRWGGSGSADDVFALSEAGGTLADHGPLVSSAPDTLCRAELRVESPGGAWTARLASAIFDEPAGLLWDTPGLLVVTYGFMTYGFEARTGVLRWSHRSATPLIGAFGSPRLDHVVVQGELETFALDESGEVRWRVAHSDVVAEADLVGGRLVLRSYAGLMSVLDPATGRPAA
ncbi:MAG TPA: PQQ-binding-like beta-propeller repeat protein [Candidatus Limnocylindrales bacterium]